MKVRKGTGAELTIVGRLKEIPEIRKTQNDKSVANITLAADSLHNNSAGKLEEYTEWFNITVWGQAAEFIRDYCHAGMRLYIEASVKHEKEEVEDKQDKKYVFYIPKFHAFEVQPMDAIKKSEPNE